MTEEKMNVEELPIISLELSRKKTDGSPLHAAGVIKALECFQSFLKYGTRKKIVGETEDNGGENSFPAEFLSTEEKPLKFRFLISGQANSQVYFLLDILSRISRCTSEKDLLKRFLKHCGHFLFYMKTFCWVLLRERCRAKISLDVPGDKVSKSVLISRQASRRFFKLLKENRTLVVEKTKIVGRFMGFDYSSGKWILKTEDGREFFGSVERLSKLKTKTVVIQDIVYSCIVEERIVGFTVTGEEKISRKLVGFFPLKK